MTGGRYRSWTLPCRDGHRTLDRSDGEFRIVDEQGNGIRFARPDARTIHDTCEPGRSGRDELTTTYGTIGMRATAAGPDQGVRLVALGDRPTWRPLAGCGHGRVHLDPVACEALRDVLARLAVSPVELPPTVRGDLPTIMHAPRSRGR